MQKVPPRKPKQLQPGVPKLKLGHDFPLDSSNNSKEISQSLKNMPGSIMTTTSQFQTNSQTSLTTSRKTSVSSSSSSQKLHMVNQSLEDLKNNMKEMKSIKFLHRSADNLVDDHLYDDPQPVITYPDDTPVPSEVTSPTNLLEGGIKFESKTSNNVSTTKVVKEGFSAEKASAKYAESKSLQSGDVSYEENCQAAAHHAKLEMNGISAEKSLIRAKEARSIVTAEKTQQEQKKMEHTSMKVTGTFSSEQTAAQQGRISSEKIYNAKHTSTSKSIYTSTKGLHTSSSTSLLQTNKSLADNEDDIINMKLDDLQNLSHGSSQQEVTNAIEKYRECLSKCVNYLKQKEGSSKPLILNKIDDIMNKAWAVPTHGHELGYSLCNALRECGGLDLLMDNCTKNDTELQFSTAKVLEQCLTTENRAHVVTHGLDKVVNVACACTNHTNSVQHSRVGTGILEHLFKHSEETCSDVVRLGGLDALLFECRKSDVETLRHCAGALANLSLYGGAENQEAMIKRKVPMWLFPLAFHNDDNIKYYACLAITVLVANAEIEADVLQSGTLGLVEPFVTTHNPSEFAKSNLAHAHGQSKTWLQHLVPVLSSKREEARNLAAFHFCMEAGIKKQQGNTNIFGEIGAIESLKRVASCPNAVASKYAARALRLIGEEVPHKLSQQVPLWSAEDVEEWVKQIGFTEYAGSFIESRVDGDLLLQLTEENLREDIGLSNGIKRIRFFRELQKLKRMADYSSRDAANINNFLQSMGTEFSTYTYSMLNAGVETKESLRSLSEDQLLHECGIINSIHRLRIMDGIRALENGFTNSKGNDMDKSLDVFVSYRRSNGSQLASLLKVHLQLRGFSVFIDVERLEAGKFDNNLLQSIQKAKHFLLVLTPNALERCIGDGDRKDWVHREIVAALGAQCNIIPIVDNFQFPDAEDLPEDMRQVCHFNAIKWIHDYQDACVDKLERFMRGELNARADCLLNRVQPGTPSNAGLTRAPPNYQRMHSNDSGSGKGSDKDVNGNSGLRD